MAYLRTVYPHFQLANEIYAGAIVTLYEVDINGQKTAVKATLYEDLTGTKTLRNPQKLNSKGMFERPVYISAPVVATVTGLVMPDHDTGVTRPPAAPPAGAVKVDDLATLRALAGPREQNDLVYVFCYDTIDDGGYGWFRFDAASTAADNDGTVIEPDDSGGGAGRWIRVPESPSVLHVTWFGAKMNGTGNQKAAWDKTIAAASIGQTIHIPNGVMRTTEPLTLDVSLNLTMNGVILAAHDGAAMILDGPGLGGGGFQGARYHHQVRLQRNQPNHEDLNSDGLRIVTSYHGHLRLDLIKDFTTGLHFLPAAALDDLPDITSGAAPYNKIEIGRIHNCLRSIHCDPNQNYPAWVTGEAVSNGDRRYHANRLYEAASSGTTGANGPRHTAGTASDGAVDWLFIRNMGFVNQNLFEGGRIHWPLGGRRRNSAGWEAALISVTGGNRANGNKFNNLSCEDGGIHRGIQPWQSGATVLKWDRWVSTDGDRVYVAENDGTLDGSEPTHTSGTATHGDVTVRYAGRPHLSPYTPGQAVTAGDRRRYRDPATGVDNDYEAASSGTAGLPGPTHTSGTVADGGGVDWTYLGRSFAEHRYSHSYEEGDLAWNREALYLCEGAGTTAAQTLGSKGPSDKSGNTFSDGTVTWRYIGPEYAWTIDGAGRQNEWATLRAERGRSIRFHAQDGNNVLRLGNYMRLKDFEDETVGTLGNEIICRGGGGAVDQGGGGFTPWRYETPSGAAIHLRSRSTSTDEALQIALSSDPNTIRLGLAADGIHRLFQTSLGVNKYMAIGRFASTPGTQRTWGAGSINFPDTIAAGDPAGHVALSTGTSPTWAPFGQVGYRENAGSPSGVLTPKRIGEWVFDTSGGDWYWATGLTNTDWKAIT